MNRVVDIIAKLIAGLALLVVFSLAALVVFFKVTDEPKEFRDLERDRPVIDILPNGGGLEGELDRDALARHLKGAGKSPKGRAIH